MDGLPQTRALLERFGDRVYEFGRLSGMGETLAEVAIIAYQQGNDQLLAWLRWKHRQVMDEFTRLADGGKDEVQGG